MRKIFIILFTFHFSLFGYTSIKTLKFESGITIYGQIGFVDVVLTQNFDNNTYEMKATTTSIGAVKYLTNNRRDIFTSEGQIKNGVYTPFKFTKEAIEDNYKKITTYFFNYKENTVYKTVSKEEYKTISSFDVTTFSYKDQKKLIQEKSEENIKLYNNDYLSLYLNMQSNNLKLGKVSYVDKKETDTLIYKEHNLVEVQKHDGEDIYSIAVHYDDESIFFKKIESIGVSFYGDAYIEKISEETKIIHNDS